MLVVPQSTVTRSVCAAGGERAHRLDIGAVALEQTVGNMDQRLAAGMAQKARQQRGGSGAVDVVVAEYGDRLAALNRVRNAGGGLRHRRKYVRIGHRMLDGRIEKRFDRVDLDIAPGEDAGEQFGKIVPLRDRQRPRGPARVEPVAPGAPGRRVLDAEERPTLTANSRDSKPIAPD